MHQPKPINPAREWAIGLIIVLIILGGIGIWSSLTYLKYKNSSVSEASVLEEEMVVYRESLVKAALEKFAQREENLNTKNQGS